ncbi:MAG: HEPN domain-containing protein [Candidatus Zambryskibacteria bacterium]|nr:HEPN domain-containing protein [Candidatus Zambryskibacteria bacterium]
MNPEFEQCLKRNKIREFPRGKAIMTKTLEIAQRDLERAEKTFNDKDYKWATIQSYYSMFHSARALLFAKNYREHSHYCLIIAMRALYVETRLLPGSLIEALGKGKRLREDTDYYDRWSEEGASFALKVAGDFLKKAQELTKGL